MASLTQVINYYKMHSKESFIYNLILGINDIPFDVQEIEALQSWIITSINSRLNQASTRCSGLRILNKILNIKFKFSKDTFTKYGLLWITKATQVLENVQNKYNLTLACEVIGCLIKHCKEISELNKQISMQNVKQLINIVCALKTDEKCAAVYYLIAVLLYHYPEVCEKYQMSIMKILLIQIDSTQKDVVNASAKCYVLLSQIMERSFKPLPEKPLYNAWTYNEALLCNILHNIMNTLFSGLIELEHVDIWDQLELPPISENNIIQYYNAQKQRFSNVCIYLSTMLCYQAKNFVFPYDILTVLCRGLAITSLNLKDTQQSFKEQMLYIILPKMHISLFSVLDGLINGFIQELIPFGTKIMLLFQQTLQWTSTVLDNQITISDVKSFKSIRIHAYKCLSSWLINIGFLSGIEIIANECLIYILRDIMPERNRILLTVQPKTQRSKRAMKRFKDNQYENSTILNNETSSAKNESLDIDLCKEALIVLQNILSSNSILITKTFYKNIYNSIIPLLYNFYLDSPEPNFYKTHNKCRLELFKVLKALQMNSYAMSILPMQYCLEISQRATYDIDRNIVKEANQALTELEKIIHPFAPTLQLPRQQEPDNEIAENQVEESEIDENQIEENLSINKSKKRNKIEEESFSDADVISSIRKRSRITVEECTKIVEIEKNTEPMETSSTITDTDKSQADDICNLSKTHIVKTSETKNTLQEQEKIHCEKIQIDEILMDIIIEDKAECELTKLVSSKEQEQNEQFKDLTSSTNQINETVSTDSSLPKDIITEERKELLQDNVEKKKEMTLESLESLFNDN